MRKLITLTILFFVLSLAFVAPSKITPISANHNAYFTPRCTDAGQPSLGPVSCDKIFYYETADAKVQAWDPQHDYEVPGGAVLQSVYNTPIAYKDNAPSLSSLVPTPDVASVGVSNPPGTYIDITPRAGIHAWRLNSSTPTDLGAITLDDWVFSLLRGLAMCEGDGPEIVVYSAIYGAQDWINYCTSGTISTPVNATVLAHWATFIALNPVVKFNSTSIRVNLDGDLNATNGQTATPVSIAFEGVLGQSWAGVVKGNEVLSLCGGTTVTDIANGFGEIAKDCTAYDSYPAHGFGTGPYLIDESVTTATQIVLKHNSHYCDAPRTAPICDGPAVTGTDSSRLQVISISTVPSEPTRTHDFALGTADYIDCSIAGCIGNFLTSPSFTSLNTVNCGSSPAGSCLYNGVEEYQHGSSTTLIVDSFHMIITRSTAGHTKWGTSVFEGSCDPTPSKGCLARRAVIAGFDYATWIANVCKNICRQIDGPIPIPFAGSEQNCVTAGLCQEPSQNIALATSLALAAGYSKTKPMIFTCWYPTGSVTGLKSCTQLRGDLANIKDGGVSFVIANVNNDLFANIVSRPSTDDRPYDLWLVGWAPDYVDEDDYIRPYFYTGVTYALDKGYSNATVDGLINAAASATGATRANDYFHLMNITNADCSCEVWLRQREGRYLLSAAVGGYASRGLNPNFYSFYQDLSKTIPAIPPSTITSTPVFSNAITAVVTLLTVALTATVLLRRFTARRIRIKPSLR